MSPSERSPPAPIKVRRAVLQDLLGMARVHVDGWKTAYRGLVPDDILDNLTVERDVASGFGGALKLRRPGAEQFVAVAPDDEIVGYALACPNRDPDPEFTGELEAIYVRKSHQGRGVGTALVGRVARYLESTGKTSMIVWVLERNPYQRFYEHLGGVLVRKRMGRPHRLGGGPLPEVGYGWKDLASLTGM